MIYKVCQVCKLCRLYEHDKQNHIVVGFDYDTDRGYNRKFRYFCKKVLL